MEMRKIASRAENVERNGFSNLRGMVERSARVAAILLAISAANCGGSPTPHDGGDPMNDGGTHQDGGSGGSDSGTTSLCAMYPDGDAHRKVFHLNDVFGIPGSTYNINFLQAAVAGTTRGATFRYYVTGSTSSDFISLNVGDSDFRDVPGKGRVTFELCQTTGNNCSYNGSITGDPSCTATLASTAGW